MRDESSRRPVRSTFFTDRFQLSAGQAISFGFNSNRSGLRQIIYRGFSPDTTMPVLV